ncbi:MAG: 4Fe-4S dicluster domain-containing protein [Flavonifractor plautii]
MDGVLAMEGDGPGASGTPRHAGVLAGVRQSPGPGRGGRRPHRTASGLQSGSAGRAALGLRPSYIEEVELLGELLEALRMDDYRFPSRIKGNLMEFLGPLAGPASKLCKRVLSQTPKIRTDACVGCGICKSACPGKAISMDGPGGKARIDPRACIHCYCRHELCPQKAVALRQNWLGRYLK